LRLIPRDNVGEHTLETDRIAPPTYALGACSNLIYARFEGTWNVTIDLEFMTELGQQMLAMKCHHWGFLVDMRHWDMPQHVIDMMQTAKVHLNRRNQIAECWIVQHPEQGRFIEPLITQAQIPLQRCSSLSSAMQWLETQGVDTQQLTPDCRSLMRD